MQGEPPDRVRAAAVGRVADDRMAEAGEMDPDLVPPAGLQTDLEERVSSARTDHLPVGDGGAPALEVARLTYPAGCVVEEPARDGARGAGNSALDHRQVRPLDGVRRELRLERPLGDGGGGEDEQPRSEAIEPMDDEDAARWPPRPGAGGQVHVRGALPIPLGRDGEEARRLVDHQQVVVLVHDSQAGRQGGVPLPGADLHDVAGRERGARAPDRRAVHAYPAGGEHLLPGAARGAGEEPSEAVAERDRGVDRVSHRPGRVWQIAAWCQLRPARLASEQQLMSRADTMTPARALLLLGALLAASSPAGAVCDPPRCIDVVVPVPKRLRVPDSTVRLLLPEGYRGSRTRYPVLYLLHGAGDTFATWTERTDVQEFTAALPLIVVMPDAGHDLNAGFYSDWVDGSRQWETFHTQVLRRYIDGHFRTLPRRNHRAVAGLSMGGFGAMSYAARHRRLFRAAASFSGAVDTLYPVPATNVLFQTQVVNVGIWGNPATAEDTWQEHNPIGLASTLRRSGLS